VDASFHVDGCEGATDAVLLNYKGRFIAAATKCLPNIAINYGDSSERGINSLAEGDSSKVIDMCKGERIGCYHG
jgi:hypothetical protein